MKAIEIYGFQMFEMFFFHLSFVLTNVYNQFST